MRQLSKLAMCLGWSPFARESGEYEKSEEDSEEPARTERLLASPFTVFHQNAGDAFDAISLFWLSRSTGMSIYGVLYDFICYLVLLAIAVAYGMEAYASEYGTDGAIAQGMTVVCLQLLLAVYIFVLRPSIDRIENAQNWIQMACEGTSTLLLVLPLLAPDLSSAESQAFTGFLLALFAVFIPIFVTLYETFLVPIINWWANGGKLSELFATIIEIFYSLPGMCLGLLGYDSADVVDAMAQSSKDLAQASESVTAGDDVVCDTHMADAIPMVNPLGILGVGATGSHDDTDTHAAALVIQRLFRGYAQRSQHYHHSYLHTYVHDDASEDAAHLMRQRAAHRWQEAAARTIAAIHRNEEDEDVPRALLRIRRRSRVSVRKLVQRPAAPQALSFSQDMPVPSAGASPPPSFSREVSLLSVREREIRDTLYDASLKV